MTNQKNKHWRDTFKSDYLASWDLDGVVTLEVEKCVEQECQLQRKELKSVLYFKEKELPNGVKVKPMILNATNCKAIHKATGTPYINLWTGFKVELMVVDNSGRIGHDKGLKISNVILSNPTDISHILKSNDLDFVKKEGNAILSKLNNEQKIQIRNHITKLSENVQS